LRRVVVCGGGIIGAATAYYLTTKGVRNITVVERHRVAGAASGVGARGAGISLQLAA
jgi:glycine/D-amino acid oxidase-like deaminating enzyme